MKYWLSTDWHFNHEAIKREDFEGRPDNYEELIIKRHNAMISDNDFLVVLGDVIFARSKELKDYLGRMNGKKILVKGNHDKNTDSWYVDMGFSFVCDSIILKGCLLSHAPMLLTDDLRLNIHGHFHSGKHRAEDKHWYDFYSDRHILLSSENTNYFPVQLTDVINGRYVKEGVVYFK